MLKLILVRHGETLYNKEEIFRGKSEIPLNEKGRLQAKMIAQALKSEQLTAIYSSPQLRALETANAIAKPRRLKIIPHPGLADLDFGNWQGKSITQVKNEYPQIYSLWLTDPFKAKIPQGENLIKIKTNLKKLLAELSSLCPQGTIALVTHRLVVKVFLILILNLKGPAFWQIKPEVASFSRIEKKTDSPSPYILNSFNETWHLKDKNSSLEDF